MVSSLTIVCDSSPSSDGMSGRMRGRTQLPTVNDRMKKNRQAEKTDVRKGARIAMPLKSW